MKNREQEEEEEEKEGSSSSMSSSSSPSFPYIPVVFQLFYPLLNTLYFISCTVFVHQFFKQLFNSFLSLLLPLIWMRRKRTWMKRKRTRRDATSKEARNSAISMPECEEKKGRVEGEEDGGQQRSVKEDDN